jgi:hypothetical protein
MMLIYFNIQDFGVTVIFTIFFFAGSIAWAKAISDIQYFTNPDNVISANKVSCPQAASCISSNYPTYTNIVISCVTMKFLF